ncbi:hypothetical protein [Micromonospora coerulea]|uniref:hypothetical protein n=1 Tax=Micromonospora coerulea TaxID=47856 RepID=UPI0019075D85|nr:hypothetical protein [Micromonospora veneta]
MTHADRTGSGWRARWARRENARRRRAHEDAIEAWCLRGVRLQRLRAAAEDHPTLRPTVPVDLAHDETVVAVQPSTGLVTVPRHADLPPPELSAIPITHPHDAPPLPQGSRVTAAGTVVVTDRRIVLVGRHGTSEFPYARLSGLTHHPAVPVTLLHGPTGALVAGLRVPRGAAARFRLRLTLAYADATGQRNAVLARLDEAVVANRRSRPAAAMLVSAAQAPGYARLTRPAVAAAAAALVALVAFAATIGPAPTNHPPTALPTGGGMVVLPATTTPGADTAVGSAASSAPADDPVVPNGPAPHPVPAGMAGGGRMPAPVDRRASLPADRATGPAPRTARPARPVPAPSATPSPTSAPTPAPTPTPPDRCGAPENPLGYTYCGGALIHEPAADVCRYFVCVDGFRAGHGYLARCGDGTVGRVGGRYGSCPQRSGRKEPVYRASTNLAGADLVAVPSDLL